MRAIDADKLLENHNLYKRGRYSGNPHAMDTLMMYEIKDMIENAPTVMEWIPVTKRMPEEHEREVQIFDGIPWGWIGEDIDGTESDYVLVTVEEDGKRFTDVDYTENGSFHMSTIAWMPLPDPYEGGQNE